MDWTDFLAGIVSLLFSALAAIVSVLLSPLDLLVNFVVPGATSTVHTFFEWINATIQQFGDFINWFLYLIGIDLTTWRLIMLCLMALLLIFIVTVPLKIIFSAFKGFKS